MDKNRRSFLKKASCTTLGMSCGLPLLATGCSSKHGHCEQEPSEDQLTMVIDVDLCDEAVRRACCNACNSEHNIPFIPNPKIADPAPKNPSDIDPKEGIKWIWDENYENAFPDQVHAQAKVALKKKPLPVLVLCNHCTRPSCVRVCPTQATWKRKSDGIVMMDMHRCIGCRYCIAACPYGARSFNWRDPRLRDQKTQELLYFANNEFPSKTYPTRSKGVVEKCNFCAERIRFGKEPKCVIAAEKVKPGALTFGHLKNSKIQNKLRDKRTICRRVSLGTGPNVLYVV